MRLYNLGKAPWADSQLIYHALARLNREALVLVSPAEPYVCVGFHQDAQQEVDLAYCRARNLPVFRREVGGGAVYLDHGQLFWQMVLKRDSPLAPKARHKFYEKFLQPVINVYRALGMQAQYKPVNDVLVGSRKVSGTGVGEIGDCLVCVGNIIRDFNFVAMARMLKVPDEKFRDKLHQGLEANLSTVKRELGQAAYEKWDDAKLSELLADEFSRILGPLEPVAIDAELSQTMERLKERMLDENWLVLKRKAKDSKQVKLRHGVFIQQNTHKAPGGLLRATFQKDDDRLRGVFLSGDFFSYPPDAVEDLEAALEGVKPEQIGPVISDFYTGRGWETPGIALENWLKVLET